MHAVVDIRRQPCKCQCSTLFLTLTRTPTQHAQQAEAAQVPVRRGRASDSASPGSCGVGMGQMGPIQLQRSGGGGGSPVRIASQPLSRLSNAGWHGPSASAGASASGAVEAPAPSAAAAQTAGYERAQLCLGGGASGSGRGAHPLPITRGLCVGAPSGPPCGEGSERGTDNSSGSGGGGEPAASYAPFEAQPPVPMPSSALHPHSSSTVQPCSLSLPLVPRSSREASAAAHAPWQGGPRPGAPPPSPLYRSRSGIAAGMIPLPPSPPHMLLSPAHSLGSQRSADSPTHSSRPPHPCHAARGSVGRRPSGSSLAPGAVPQSRFGRGGPVAAGSGSLASGERDADDGRGGSGVDDGCK